MKSRTSRFLSLTLLAFLPLSAASLAINNFTVTGHMAFPRRRHAATLLGSGKILVTGGANATGTLATAELFNPATGTFTRTGNMTTARAGQAATLLATERY